MDTRFLPHNTHLENPKLFSELDPQLRLLNRQIYQYSSPLLYQLPYTVPGIYTLGGGRQIGKSTLLKQWMSLLLEKGVAPQAIAYFMGELIDDHHSLVRLMQQQLAEMPQKSMRYLIIDEVTYIKDWDKGVKYAADAGWLENVVLMITGSELVLIQEARMRFPGRRGKATQADFHMYPLSFREVVQLKNAELDIAGIIQEPSTEILELLHQEFLVYLQHGGYLTAINDIAAHGRIFDATLTTYSDWIRGDMLKRGKQEHYLREILSAIIKRYNSQITWNSLAQDLSIDHPKTVADYVEFLASLDAIFIQAALLEDKLTAAPKKAKKLVCMDPFIFHALRAWIFPVSEPYETQILPAVEEPELCSGLVEACVTTHFCRHYPTYYIKADGEIDLAYIDKNRFWPIEIKWINQLRPKDLKQISKYPQAKIWTKTLHTTNILGIKTEPLVLALLQLV